MLHKIAIFAPLLSFLILSFFGRLMGNKRSQALSCVLLFVSAIASILVFYDVVVIGKHVRESLMAFIYISSLKSNWGFYIDVLAAVMMTVVTIVSFLVHVYSVGYMDHDRTPVRFMSYLGLFTFMMLMLVTGESFLQLFFGWEGVGLASYLLIGYWYEKPSACAASIKAFVVNRVGDLGLVLAGAMILLFFNTLDLPDVVSRVSELKGVKIQAFGIYFEVLELMGVLLFIGAMGKSAQFGLHTWLPDAMEGPTPVSALIHAATMVTAGVFLVARFSTLYELTYYAKLMIVYVGAFTALFAGTIALTQNDIKRVIAYSTCSQLGYMFFASGLGAYNIAIFHLVTHAFFKALLFLGSGSVIHAMSDEQDMRKMGGIWRGVPVTYMMMWIGSLALAGIPFFAGYYSKDSIIEVAMVSESMAGKFAYVFGIVSAFLTAFYSWRLIYMTFHGKSRAHEKVLSHLHEPGLLMLMPLGVLALGALFAGYVGFEHFTSYSFWNNSIVVFDYSIIESHTSSFFVHHLPLIVVILGIFIATMMYIYRASLADIVADKLKFLYNFSLNKWYIDELYEKLFVQNSLKIGSFFWNQVDAKAIDASVVNNMAAWSARVSQKMSQAHTGMIFHYTLWMLVGLVILFFLILVIGIL